MVEPLALTAWHLFSAFLYRRGIVFVDMLTCILVLLSSLSWGVDLGIVVRR